MAPASGGMFGIKLVAEKHHQIPYFGRGGNPALMNFPDSHEGRRIAGLIPTGHRSLVYLMAPTKKIGAAIEYLEGGTKEGLLAARTQGAVAIQEVLDSHYARIWRCVRVVAWINDPDRGPALDLEFRKGDVMFDITEKAYLELNSTIPWDWEASV